MSRYCHSSLMCKRLKEEQDLLACLVRYCSNEKNLSRGKSVHKRIRRSEHSQSLYLSNLLVQMYGKCGCLEEARAVFRRIHEPNLFSWNILFQAYAQNGHLQEAWRIFEKMPKRDVVSWNTMVGGYAQFGHLQEARIVLDKLPQWDVVCWSALVTGYADNGRFEEAKSMFDTMVTRNVVSWNAMVQAYALNGHLQGAKNTFDRTPEWNLVSWNAMIQAYAQRGQLQEAKNVFAEMPEQNQVSWNSMLAAYARYGYLEEARGLFDKMPERSVVSWNTMIALYDLPEDVFGKMPQWDMVSWNAIFQAYAENGYLEEATSLFGRMPERDIVSWTTMIAVHAHGGYLERAVSTFDTMPHRDLVSWNNIMAANAHNGYLDGVRNTFSRMPKQDVVSWTTVIAAYAQHGYMEEARQTFGRIPKRNVVSWNAMIQAYAQNGHGKDALALYQEMELAGVKPDEASFKSLLMACSHAGLLHKCWQQFIAMISDHGLTPMREHYYCMIDILGRSGQLRNAEELIHNMPFLPDAMAWGTLLGGCKIHRDVERAARAAEHAFDLDPENAAPYVLLANVYAALGREQDMAAVRKRMKDRGVKKYPGFSFIEVHSKVHRFIAGDTSHPRNGDIQAELERLNGVMREHGYVPDTKEVLHDVKDEEKELLVCSHSEKLAIAFGLISTDPPLPVRVMKNLRVCSDCHTATKFISKLSQRQIIVRDAVRFHCFENGSCSCEDYW